MRQHTTDSANGGLDTSTAQRATPTTRGTAMDGGVVDDE